MTNRSKFSIKHISWIGAIIACLFGIQSASGVTTLTKDADGFSVVSPVYKAHISAKTGLLDKMEINGAVVIEKTAIDLGDRPLTKVEVVQEGPLKMVAYISAPENKGSQKIIEKALRIAYEADGDSTLLMKVMVTIGARGPYFTLGRDVQMVRSLEFKEALPMPSIQSRTPWLKVKFYYANGATLGILNQGASNPINPNENGEVKDFVCSRAGFVPNSEYVYTLIAERGEKPTLGAPSMQIIEAATPAVFWQGEPIQATLRIKKEDYKKLAGMTGLRVKYVVQDVFEQVAAMGETPLDSRPAPIRSK